MTIQEKAENLLSNNFDVGAPLSDVIDLENGNYKQNFENASIYQNDEIGTYEVHGEILKKYQELYEEQGELGFPTSDQQMNLDSENAVENTFQNGTIVWNDFDGATPKIYNTESEEKDNEEYTDAGTGSTDVSGTLENSTGSDSSSSEEESGNTVYILPETTIVGNPDYVKDTAKKANVQESQAAFYFAYIDYSIQNESESQIPRFFTLAQSALETGWSSAKPGNNMFGVKAGKNWTGEKQLLKTREVLANPNVQFPKILSVTPRDDGKYDYVVNDWFRAYETPYDSFQDRAGLLKSTRYNKAFNYTDDFEFAKEIVNAGYATAPNYYDVISSFIKVIKKIDTTYNENN